MDGMNGLAEKWGSLQLSEEEEDTIVVGEDIQKKMKLESDAVWSRRSFQTRTLVERQFGALWERYGRLANK